MVSPNLSPIRQQQNQLSSSTSTLQGSFKQHRAVNSSGKDRSLKLPVNDDMSLSPSSAVFAKSIIFMDVGGDSNEIIADLDDDGPGKGFRSSKELQDLSFCEEIIDHDHHNHHKREEFYKRASLGIKKISQTSKIFVFNDLNFLGDDDFETVNEISKLVQSKIEMAINSNDRTMDDPHMQKYYVSTKLQDNIDYDICTKGYTTEIQLNTSKPFLTSLIETTTDTGYQTNNGTCGNGSTSINSAQSSSNPSMMIMDTTSNNNTNNVNSIDINSMLAFNRLIKTKNPAISIEIEDTKENNHEKSLAAKKADLLNLKNSLKSIIATSSKRPFNSSDVNKSLVSSQPKSSIKNKNKNSNSISLNSLENIIQPFRDKFNSSSHFKPIKKASVSQAVNPRKVNFIKSKSSIEEPDKNSDDRPPLCKLYKSRSETGSRLVNEEQLAMCSSDISMCTLNNSNIKSVSIYELDDDEKLVKKKHELDSQYMDQSILMNKITPSEIFE